MRQNYNVDSFKKGELFEKYIEEVIFPETHFEILDKTSDSDQNTRRFVRKSLEPDFHFRCRVSGKSFYIEAKWRAKPYQDLYQVLSEKQYRSFPKIHTEENPIFIALGYGGHPSEPDYVSLIPYKEVVETNMSPRNVYKFNIEKTYQPPNFHENRILNSGNFLKENNLLISLKERISDPRYYKLFSLAALSLIAIIITISSVGFTKELPKKSSEERLREIVTNYYQSMNGNQVEKLPDFLSPNIMSWYGAKEPTHEEVMRNAKAHRGKFPFSTSNIDWDSFTVIKENNGDYHVSYEMVYKSKQNINDDYEVFDLKLITKWDADFKLKSISEIRL